MPRISVIIPTHNRAHVVGEAIDSVLAQTYQDFEVIVVDDASTDNTSEALARYVAEHPGKIRIIRRETNGGAGAARNDGIRASSGEYIAFLDSDDLYLSQRLESGIGALEASFDVGASYVDARIQEVGGQVRSPSRVRRYGGYRSGWILQYLFRGDLIETNTITVRRDVLNRVGFFDEALWTGQDTDLFWRVARYCRIEAVPSCQVITREAVGSLCRGDNSDTDRLRRLPVWLRGQERYLSIWADLPPKALRFLARRIWNLYHEQEVILQHLRQMPELPAVQARLHEIECRYSLRFYARCRRFCERWPVLSRAFRAIRQHG